MKTLLFAAAGLLAGTAALAQTATAPQAVPVPGSPPSAQTAPAPQAVPGTPAVRPMADKVMTRAEVVAMVREHFGRLDSNKDGSITTAEIEAAHPGAKDFKRFEGPGPHVMMMGDPNAAFDKLDANKDGSISRDEFAKAREERFERRIVMREELKDGDKSPKDGKGVRRHFRMHGPGGFGGRMIVMADTDKDGKITLSEAETLALQHFDQMDTNKDGQVTPEERRAGRPMMFKRTIEDKKTAS